MESLAGAIYQELLKDVAKSSKSQGGIESAIGLAPLEWAVK